MTLIDDQAAAHADALLAAYFRAELNAERQLLQVEIGKRRMRQRPRQMSAAIMTL
jgi:hypothetical protein